VVEKGNDVAAVDHALAAAEEEIGGPSLILVHTVIGYGAPNKQGTFKSHGSPLGEEELAAAKENLGWSPHEKFVIPEDALAVFRKAVTTGRAREEEWERALARYGETYPELHAEFLRRMTGELPPGWDRDLPVFEPDSKGLATRKASEIILQSIGAHVPELVGGSADLNPSTFSWLKEEGDFQRPGASRAAPQGSVGGEWGYEGRNVHFGVREHAMGAMATGMALHGGFIAYAGTFLVFSDYMRPPVRLASLSKLRVIYVFTHDSIGLGEDGPTHQPIEQLMTLRAVPNLTVIRPADAAETVEAWRSALRNTQGPTALVFTRQGVPTFDRKECVPAEALERGGYILWQSDRAVPEVIIIATGSEVHVALEAGKILAADDIGVRVVSLPSWELFDRQPQEYRDTVLPPEIRTRVAVEAGAKLGLEHYVGLEGTVVGMEGFGASAPGSVLFSKFGFTPVNVAEAARRLLDTPR
jgi:transketolase